jgi:hypothetical protein
MLFDFASLEKYLSVPKFNSVFFNHCVDNKPELNFTLLNKFSLCLVHYKVEMNYGDTEDTFQLCRFNMESNSVDVLSTKILKSKNCLSSPLTCLDIGMSLEKLIVSENSEHPLCILLFDTGDGIFLDLSKDTIQVIEEQFFDSLSPEESKFEPQFRN